MIFKKTPWIYFFLASIISLVSHGVTIAAEDVQKCRYVRTSQLAIDVVLEQPLIKGSVNHLPAEFLLDTGAYKSSLSDSFVKRHQFKLSATDRLSFGVGGDSRVYFTRVDEFSVGGIKGGAITLQVDEKAAGAVHDGLVGADFLFQSDIEISYAEKLLRHFQPLNCKNTFLAYWDANATVLDLQTMNSKDARPLFIVSLNGKPVKAMLDTGATVTFIHTEAAKRIGMEFVDLGQSSNTAKGIGAREMKVEFAKFKRLEIGEELIQDAVIRVGDFWGNTLLDHYSQAQEEANKDEAELILGIDYIREHRILFAISQRKLYLSYLGGPLFLSDSVQQ